MRRQLDNKFARMPVGLDVDAPGPACDIFQWQALFRKCGIIDFERIFCDILLYYFDKERAAPIFF